MSSLQLLHGQSSPSAGGKPALRALAAPSHSPASVLQSGQNFHDSGIPSSQPPHTPGGGGGGDPAAAPHSMQKQKLAATATSPQWQSHSAVTTGGALRPGTPMSESPHAGQNLKLPGTVQSPSAAASFFLVHELHTQSPSFVRCAGPGDAPLNAGDAGFGLCVGAAALARATTGAEARIWSNFFIAAICSATATASLGRGDPDPFVSTSAAELTPLLVRLQLLGLAAFGFEVDPSATAMRSKGMLEMRRRARRRPRCCRPPLKFEVAEKSLGPILL